MSVARILTVVLIAGALTLVWAAPKDSKDAEIARLEQRVAALEQAIQKGFGDLSKQMNEKFAALEKQIEVAGRSEAERERLASQKYGQVNKLVADGKFLEAKTELAALMKDYGDTNSARRASRLQAELSVIGKDTPASLGVEQWFQGDEVDLGSGKATLVVFWEEWCPHCKREVPKLEAVYNKFKDQGLQMVGLTKLSKGSTEEKVMEFIKSNNVSYPIAKENGDASSYFAVSGIPAAAVVKDGKVVWRGHPARLNDAMLEGWL